MPERTDQVEHAIGLLAHARAAGVVLRNRRAGLTAAPANRIDPNLMRQLSAACSEVRAALRAEAAVQRIVRRVGRRAMAAET